MTIGELLDRRLLFTVGKGGVGRTTVSLALALEAARRGKRVLVVELEGAKGLGLALDEQRARGGDPRLARIEHLEVEGRRALEEYLGLIIPVRRLLGTVFSSKIYQYFVAAAPGLRELMTVGKIFYEVERDDGRAPDLVIVDGPATGHSLQYLRMPRAAAEAFPVGLVHREALRVHGLLQDETRTGVVIVATAEEMPVNETIEIAAGLAELGLPRSLLVVNRIHEAPLAGTELDSFREDLGTAAPGRGRDLLAAAIDRAGLESGWAAINRENAARLAQAVPLPTVLLPHLFAEEFGAAQVREVSQRLAAALGDRPAPAGRGRSR